MSVQDMLLKDPPAERSAAMSAAYIPNFGKSWQIQYTIINLYHRCIVAAATFSPRNVALLFEMSFECHDCFSRICWENRKKERDVESNIKIHIYVYKERNGEVPREEKMLSSGTDPESYVTECTLVFEDSCRVKVLPGEPVGRNSIHQRTL